MNKNNKPYYYTPSDIKNYHMIDYTERYGDLQQTVIHQIAEKIDYDSLKFLYKKCPDKLYRAINIPDINDETPLDRAIQNISTETLKHHEFIRLMQEIGATSNRGKILQELDIKGENGSSFVDLQPPYSTTIEPDYLNFLKQITDIYYPMTQLGGAKKIHNTYSSKRQIKNIISENVMLSDDEKSYFGRNPSYVDDFKRMMENSRVQRDPADTDKYKTVLKRIVDVMGTDEDTATIYAHLLKTKIIKDNNLDKKDDKTKIELLVKMSDDNTDPKFKQLLIKVLDGNNIDEIKKQRDENRLKNKQNNTSSVKDNDISTDNKQKTFKKNDRSSDTSKENKTSDSADQIKTPTTNKSKSSAKLSYNQSRHNTSVGYLKSEDIIMS